MRSDAALIKRISKTHSPKTGFFWQQLPYVDVASLVPRLGGQMRDVAEAHRDLDHLAWEDVVFGLGVHRDEDYEVDISLFVRVTTHTEYARTWRRISPWMHSVNGRAGGIDRMADIVANPSLVIEVWAFPLGTYPMQLPEVDHPGVIIVPRHNPWETKPIHLTPSLVALAFKGGNEQLAAATRAAVNGDALWGLIFTAYLAACPEHIVETWPATDDSTPRRQNDPKPWTYDHLPTYVLLDPSDTSTGAAHRSPEGTHASPRPHQRRGHWRLLRDLRFKDRGSKVFVKPAWVGPREWIMEGTRYRVIDPGADS